jgi:hypothetical protein
MYYIKGRGWFVVRDSARKHGISDGDICHAIGQAMVVLTVDEGYEDHELTVVYRRGRPPLGQGPSRVVQVRLDPDLHSDLEARVESEGATASTIMREALRRYLAS